MTQISEVVVVGAGVVGAAVAWKLAQEGVQVTVVDAGPPGCGTTAAGMGHIVIMDDSEAQLQLTTYSRKLLQALSDEFPAMVEWDPCGTLWLARDEEEMAPVREKQATYGRVGVDTEVLGPEELAEAEPSLAPGLAGALRVPDDIVLYPPALAAWFLDRARELGAKVELGLPVLRLEPGTAVTRKGNFSGQVVINAAGYAAPTLSPGLPVTPKKGHLAITDRYPRFCRHQLVELGYLKSAHGTDDDSVAFNVQPRPTGQILIGSSRQPGDASRAIRWDLVRKMLDSARAFLPRIDELNVIRVWTGVRPSTADSLPLIGPWPEQEGVWVASGHEGLGITTAIGTAHVLVDSLLGREAAVDPVAFDPAREALRAGAHDAHGAAHEEEA
ncbi:MAG: FAD-dependent oxidoreductase [Gemmatimonadota bacterium]